MGKELPLVQDRSGIFQKLKDPKGRQKGMISLVSCSEF